MVKMPIMGRKENRMKKIYFLVGSQDLYGEITLKKVIENSNKIKDYFKDQIKDVEFVGPKLVIDNDSCLASISEANNDLDCIGVMCFMHTFSPAKMWINGLKILNKPLLHLHTQMNVEIPYKTIDMDYMNLNQSAHGDREFGFILARMKINHDIIVGHYEDKEVITELKRFIRVCRGIDTSKHIRCAMFGNNMRDVAVTDGDRVESQIDYGWQVNYYALGDLVEEFKGIKESEIDERYQAYLSKYTLNTDQILNVKEQAKYDLALERFLKKNKINAFTDTFQDLYGLNELPGLAVQSVMSKGIGFAAEGDYKTACLGTIFKSMAEGESGATGFMENYTYDYSKEEELGAHMLEVDPSFAKGKINIEVHDLSIGNRDCPARLVFKGKDGEGVAVCMIDMGDHFRLVASEIKLVSDGESMPKLPVGSIMWKDKPTFKEGIKEWLTYGGGHHTIVSTCLTKEDIMLFAKLTNTEIKFVE